MASVPACTASRRSSLNILKDVLTWNYAAKQASWVIRMLWHSPQEGTCLNSLAYGIKGTNH